MFGRFILPFFKSFGKVDTAVQEKRCHDSDKLIKLSLLSIICIAKKKNLNFFVLSDKKETQDKCRQILYQECRLARGCTQ